MPVDDQLQSLRDDILETINSCDSPPGYFMCSKLHTDHVILPGLYVENHTEQIAFPLQPSVAQQLIQLSEKAPFGRGTETIYDDSVRKCFQIDASKVKIRNQEFYKYLKSIKQQIHNEMGIHKHQPIQFELYKLLIYEKDCFFQEHRDTEKKSGMFGTLVISLPSQYEGGEMTIAHGNSKITIDHASKNQYGMFHLAFYADCRHEIKPIRSGYRIALVYNLIRHSDKSSTTRMPTIPRSMKFIPEIKRHFRDFIDCGYAGDVFAFGAQHDYTELNLHTNLLKGSDQHTFSLLKLLQKEIDFRFYICLFEKKESGQVEYMGYRDSEMCMGEVEEEEVSVILARNSNDEIEHGVTLEIDSFVTHDDLEGLIESKQSIEESHGNYGATIEQWYRSTCFVIEVPEEIEFDEDEEDDDNDVEEDEESNSKDLDDSKDSETDDSKDSETDDSKDSSETDDEVQIIQSTNMESDSRPAKRPRLS